jgi:hypothetical protein
MHWSRKAAAASDAPLLPSSHTLVQFAVGHATILRYSQKVLQATVLKVFNRIVSKGLIKNVNGFIINKRDGRLARVKALFRERLDHLVLAPDPPDPPQSGSSESHPGVEPLLLGNRIKARARK